MDKLPDRTVINLQPPLGELGDKAAQGEVSLNPLQKKDTMFARNRLWPVAAHLARRHATGLSLPAHPSDRRANGNPELLSCLVAGQPSVTTPATTRSEDPLNKACPSMLASNPASMVNQKLPIWESPFIRANFIPL